MLMKGTIRYSVAMDMIVRPGPVGSQASCVCVCVCVCRIPPGNTQLVKPYILVYPAMFPICCNTVDSIMKHKCQFLCNTRTTNTSRVKVSC